MRYPWGAAASAAILLSISSQVFAQNTSTNSSNNGVETVVVTGTRIPRPELDLANPVTTLGSQEIEHSGTVNLTDYLKRIPALAGSLGDYQTNGYATPAAADGASLAGLNLLDLRNLGYVRTLILIDGHRTVGQSTGSSAVDVGSIPITLIDRIEVVTGGSSAVYGADGVSGVVNFVMKHDLDGIQARAQVGMSQDGGGNKYLQAVSIGHNFDTGNANLTFTFENSHQDELYFTQRDFTKLGGFTAFVSNPADRHDDPNVPDNIPTNDAAFIFSAPTGAIDTNLDGLPDRLGNGNRFHLGTSVGGGAAIGSSGMPFAYDLQGDFQPIENRRIAQVAGNYTFSNLLKVSAELKYAHVDTEDQSIAPFDDLMIITSDNPFLPNNVAARMNANTTGLGILSADYLQLRNREKVTRDVYRGVLDASGNLPSPDFLSNLKYDASYVYGQSDIDDVNIGNRNIDRFVTALDSVTDPATGQPVCRSNLNAAAAPPDLFPFFGVHAFSDTALSFDSSDWGSTFTPGPNSGCAPFNPFNPNDPNNKAAIAFITQSTHVKGFVFEQVANAYVSANVPAFKDWFDDSLSLVMGGEWREEKSKSTPDLISQTPGLFWIGGTLPVAGKFTVSEAFGEASLPVFKNRPFADELTFDVAGRYSHYSTAGDNTSWKIDGIWAPISDIKFRATDAVAVRAPNVGELFAPQQQLFAFVNDPCDYHFINNGTSFRAANCQAIEDAVLGPGHYVAGSPTQGATQTDQTTPNLVGGNPHLSSETARTYTLGVVLQPSFIPNFVATVDWYRVKIINAIQAPSGQSVADECVDLSTIANPFCAEITRTATGNFPGSISQVVSTQINVAAFFTQGVDFTATYHADLDEWFGDHLGTLDFHLIGNHLDSIRTTALPGEAPVNSANTINGGVDGTPTPFWQANLDMVWNRDEWTVDYNVDWYDGVLIASRQTIKSQPDFVAHNFIHLKPRNVHSIQVDYDMGGGFNAYVGVDNLWYQKPDIGQNGYPVDPVGRLFYAGLKADLGL